LIVGEAPNFSGSEGGPFSPSQVIFNLKANGAGFDWIIDNALPAWLVATPAGAIFPTMGMWM